MKIEIIFTVFSLCLSFLSTEHIVWVTINSRKIEAAISVLYDRKVLYIAKKNPALNNKKMAEHTKDQKYKCQPQMHPVCMSLNTQVYELLFNIVFKAWLHPLIINSGEPL